MPLTVFEILHGPLVFFRRGAGWERAQLRRLPVRGSVLREYSRYSPDLSLRIMAVVSWKGCENEV
jgi:hypothetical protein